MDDGRQTADEECGPYDRNIHVLDEIFIIKSQTMSKYSYSSQQTQNAEIIGMINRILESNGRPVKFTQSQLKDILISSKHIINEQSILLELSAPLKIVGNINGHFNELINIFKMSGYPGDVSYLFLGDYIDKTVMSLQCIVLLLCYKIRFPQNVFLLRGHHQTASMNRFFGFYDQCKERVSLTIWKAFNEVFNVMPLCATIERKIFCVHGGISPEMESLEQITKIMRPLEITNGVPLDMLWSDPEPNISGWQDNERGVSYGYGYDSVQSFLKNNKLDLIVRSHQIVENGFEFMFSKQLVTIFSVPNFMGEYDNYGAVMAVEEELKCSFQIIKPKFKHRRDPVKRFSPFKK